MKPVVIIWFALLVSVVMFLGVAWFVGPSLRSAMPEVFVWVMLGIAVSNAALAHVFPRVLKAADPQARSIIGFALAESACLLSGVAWMLTGDSRCLLGFGIGFLSLAASFPREPEEDTRLLPPR